MQGPTVRKASPRTQARLRLHYALKPYVTSSVSRYVAGRGGKPSFAFGDSKELRGGIFFGELTRAKILYLGGMSFSDENAPAALKRSDVVIGTTSPSNKQGGRARHVYDTWFYHGRQVAELKRVVHHGTALTSQALRRKLRIGTNDVLWLIERIVLHDDRKLMENVVRKERGHGLDHLSERDQRILQSLNFGSAHGGFTAMEQLVTEIDPELAEYVSELDGKYPRQQEAAGMTADHEDAVAPLDLSAAQQQPLLQQPPQQSTYVGFAPAAGRYDNPPPQEYRPPQWGAQAAAGWSAYDPGAAAGNPPAGGTTPPGTPPRGTTPDYVECKTPTYGSPTSPCAGAGGAITPTYAPTSPVSPH